MHIPVLLNEIIEQIESNKNYVDCTLGFGGHSKEILKKNGPNGKVLGIEIDKEIFEKTIKDERLIAVNDSYVNLEKIVEKLLSLRAVFIFYKYIHFYYPPSASIIHKMHLI